MGEKGKTRREEYRRGGKRKEGKSKEEKKRRGQKGKERGREWEAKRGSPVDISGYTTGCTCCTCLLLCTVCV